MNFYETFGSVLTKLVTNIYRKYKGKKSMSHKAIYSLCLCAYVRLD